MERKLINEQQLVATLLLKKPQGITSLEFTNIILQFCKDIKEYELLGSNYREIGKFISYDDNLTLKSGISFDDIVSLGGRNLILRDYFILIAGEMVINYILLL